MRYIHTSGLKVLAMFLTMCIHRVQAFQPARRGGALVLGRALRQPSTAGERTPFSVHQDVPRGSTVMRLMSTSSNDSSSAKGSRTSVAIVGSGAVGGYYGARLWEAGHDVKFHMRGDHYEQSKANGLNVTVSDFES